MKRLIRTSAVAVAALALLVTPVGAASADDKESSGRDGATVSITADQRTAVISARTTYIQTAFSIRKAYRAAVQPVLTGIDDSVTAQRLAVEVARDAYRVAVYTGGDTGAAKTAYENAVNAYKAALNAARDAAKAQLDAAKQKAIADTEAARAAYTTAVTAVFGSSAAVPRGLAKPPRAGWLSGKGSKSGYGDSRMGRHGR